MARITLFAMGNVYAIRVTRRITTRARRSLILKFLRGCQRLRRSADCQRWVTRLGGAIVKTVEDTRLLQEIYASDPWKLLVCCILLNQTSRRQVDKLLDDGFFNAYRYPSVLALADAGELSFHLRSLGFQNTRARRLIEMSREWSEVLHESRRAGYRWPKAETVAAMPGVGDYAEESYRFFVLRDFSRFRSGDKELKAWLRQIPLHPEIEFEGFLQGQITPMTPEKWAKLIEEGW